MNMYLIGYRCTGKTSVGDSLARRLGRTFIDADHYLEEKTGRKISEIFASGGEEEFRGIEREVIRELSASDGNVIAAGGGAVLDDRNVEDMRSTGVVILLTADAGTIHLRMTADQATPTQRPSLTDKDAFDEIVHLLHYREPFYQRAAHYQFDSVKYSVDQVVEQILSTLDRDRALAPGETG